MVTATELRARIASFAGFVLGALTGGLGFWAIGYQALIRHPTTGGVVWNGLLLVSMLAFVFAIMSPIALVMYFGANRASAVKQDLVTVGGYVAGAAFVVGLGVLGVTVLGRFGIDTAIDGIVFMDGVFGFTFGGIAGNVLARRWTRRRRARRG
jgi:hypothetical protein